MTDERVDIDGSYGEGGGQILRSAVALSAVTGKEVRVHDIRANRPHPGLSAQHVAAIEGVRELSDAKVRGNRLGSIELSFVPGRVKGGMYTLDTGTAGSISLILQALVLSSLRTEEPMQFQIKGGTNVRWSPPLDYYELVLFPLLERMGLKLSMSIDERGFYPEGGGKATVNIGPSICLRPLILDERGELIGIRGRCFSQNLNPKVCHRMCSAFTRSMAPLEVSLEQDIRPGPSTGAGLSVTASYENVNLGGGCLGEQGLPSEVVGRRAASTLHREMDSGSTLDLYGADQILPFMALAEGRSLFYVRDLTGHLWTQIWLLEQFLGTDIHLRGTDRGERVFEVTIDPTHTLSAER